MPEPRRFLPRLPLSVLEECWALMGDDLRGWYVEYGRDVTIYETHREGLMGTEQAVIDAWMADEAQRIEGMVMRDAVPECEATEVSVGTASRDCPEMDQEIREQAATEART